MFSVYLAGKYIGGPFLTWDGARSWANAMGHYEAEIK